MSEVQTTEDEVKDQKSALADLVNSSLEKDYNKANEIFNDQMTVRLSDVLDQAKVKLAGQIYNNEPEDEEIDDEELEIEGDEDADADAEEENEDDEEETEQLDSEEAEAEGDDDGSEPDEDEDEIEGAAV